MGVEAWTCDLLPARDGSSRHFQCDFWEVANDRWDGALLHPMCTNLTVSAAWAFKDPDYDKYPGVGYHQKVKPGTKTGAERREARERDIENFKRIMALPYPKAAENPAKSFLCKAYRRPDQIVQPYEFGDDASKETGLWLDELPALVLGDRFPGRWVEWPKGSGKMVERWSNQTDSGQNCLSPDDGRWLKRSETYPGLAEAFGFQWGWYLLQKGRRYA